MTREEIIALLDRREIGWKQHDPKILAEPYASDAVIESPISGTSNGAQEIRESYERLLRAWSPLEHVREELLVDGHRVVSAFELRGTHSGEFFRLPPTGKKFTIRGVSLMTIGNGRITHERRVYDFTGLLVRLGVLKATVAH